MFSCYEEGASLFYCINNVGLMWGEGPSGPVLGQGWGAFRPPSAPPPSLTSWGAGLPVLHPVWVGWLGSGLGVFSDPGKQLNRV